MECGVVGRVLDLNHGLIHCCNEGLLASLSTTKTFHRARVLFVLGLLFKNSNIWVIPGVSSPWSGPESDTFYLLSGKPVHQISGMLHPNFYNWFLFLTCHVVWLKLAHETKTSPIKRQQLKLEKCHFFSVIMHCWLSHNCYFSHGNESLLKETFYFLWVCGTLCKTL